MDHLRLHRTFALTRPTFYPTHSVTPTTPTDPPIPTHFSLPHLSPFILPFPPPPSRPQYYHAHTGIPLTDEELAFNSDDDVDTAWPLDHHCRTLEDYAESA